MIVDEKQVEFFKEIAQRQFLVMSIDEFGEDAVKAVPFLTENIIEIYKYLDYNSFDNVHICIGMREEDILCDYDSNIIKEINSINFFATQSGNKILIEVQRNQKYRVIVDTDINITLIADKSIVYSYMRKTDEEFFYIKDKITKLPPIPGSDTYFSIQTYKRLEEVLEQYAIKRVLYSECPYLKSAWLNDNNRIFLKSKPESILRDSLTDFLKITFREEVRPEQIVDTSHPVDIKLTWSNVNRVALIEIKWLGKSLSAIGADNFSSNYTDARAREGAQQLSAYLDANKIQIPDKNTKGYLVVFDARRKGTNTNTDSIDTEKGYYYRNTEIVYNPKYDELRDDFAKPIRLFMEPKITY